MSETGIRGADLRRAEWHEDERGKLAEVWRLDEFDAFLPAQCNVTRSTPNTARGMHYHEFQTDLWIVTVGMMTAHLQDMRDGVGDVVRVEMYPGDSLLIPSMVAHGYYVDHRVGVTLCYLVDKPYDGGKDEHGYRGEWPDGVVLSERDAEAPTLEELRG